MNIDSLIGNTPLIKITDKIYAKLEAYNPSGSIKDRMASYILKKAEEDGDLRPGYTIVEASSGNTGIAFAMLAANKGYGCIIIMPRNMSDERKQMMRSFGARIIEVGDNAFKDAIKTRDDLVKNFGTYWSPMQFSNHYNIECHHKTTGPEIDKQITDLGLEIAALVTGSGTGGTIMGCKKHLGKLWKNMKTVLVRPYEPAETHGIQGINDGADFLCDMRLVDEVIEIKTIEAKEKARMLTRKNGLMVGISSGANILAAEKWVQENDPRGVVVTFLCDRGERYLSCI